MVRPSPQLKKRVRRKRRELVIHHPSLATKGGSVGWYRARFAGRDPISLAKKGGMRSGHWLLPQTPRASKAFTIYTHLHSTFLCARHCSKHFANISRGRGKQSATLWLAELGHATPAQWHLGSGTRPLGVTLALCCPIYHPVSRT